MTIEQEFTFTKGDYFAKVVMNETKDTLYWIKGGIYALPVQSETLPTSPLITNPDAAFYTMTIDPRTKEIYAADAMDWTQQGIVYRYTPSGVLLDSFYVGVCPENFCWNY